MNSISLDSDAQSTITAASSDSFSMASERTSVKLQYSPHSMALLDNDSFETPSIIHGGPPDAHSLRTCGRSLFSALFRLVYGPDDGQICSASRLMIIRHFCLFHLPAISVTLYLLVLYATQEMWTTNHPTKDELNALQIAAKAHETLILLSLSDILLCRIRYGLMSKFGIPVGLITSPYEIGSPLAYFLNRGFWAAIMKPRSNRRFHWITTGIVVVVFILSLGASPSSAILMIPKLGYSRLSTSELGMFPRISFSPEFRNLEVSGYCIRGDIYATALEAQHVQPSENCLASPDCSSERNMEAVQEFIPALKYLSSGPQQVRNLTIPTGLSESSSRQVTMSSIRSQQDHSWTFATTPLNLVADRLVAQSQYTAPLGSGNMEILIKSHAVTTAGITRWKQPVVVAQCEQTTIDFLDGHLKAALTFDAFGEIISLSLPIDEIFDSSFIQEAHRNSSLSLETLDNLDITWGRFIDIQHLISAPISTAVVLTNATESDFRNIREKEQGQKVGIDLCIVQARWQEAETWINRHMSADVQTHLLVTPEKSQEYSIQDNGSNTVIKTKQEWLHLNGLSKPRSNGTLHNSEVWRACKTDSSQSICFSNLLGFFFANALSKAVELKSVGPVGFGNICQADPSTTCISHSFFKHGYHYAFSDSVGIPVAFAALLLHVFIAIAYLFSSLANRWHSSAWSDMGQLFAIALRSPPSHFPGNVGSKAPSASTWASPTFIRVGARDDKLILKVGAELEGETRAGFAPTDTGERELKSDPSLPVAGMLYR